MGDKNLRIIEDLELPLGMEIDLDEGWRKLISRQFRGNPGRGFSELIQNLLDSYPSDTPWEDRLGKIESGERYISIADFGEGMDRKRLKLLVTLGGTDKKDDPSKIGTFGIGFFSIFNPKLETKKVRVITKCEGNTVELVFVVEHQEKRPKISIRRLDIQIPYSTKIEVEFDNDKATEQCLEYAVSNLKYYPCRVLVNGHMFSSVWEEARNTGKYIFRKDYCEGFFRKYGLTSWITLLCKYEHLMVLTLPYLFTGGHDMKNDLRDFHRKEVPFLPETDAILNCNNLTVTISRDSFILNSAYEDMIKVLSHELLLYLGRVLDSDEVDTQLVLANQYILRDRIKQFLERKKEYDYLDKKEEMEVIRKLADAKVYRLNGKKKLFSLTDIYHKRSKEIPVFFTPNQTNLRWLGGAFKHDFIVLPTKCILHNGAPNFYDTLFEELFDEVVNLDKIIYNDEKIRELVERGIIDKSALSPVCTFVGRRKLSDAERRLLDKLDTILSHETVRNAITRNLFLPIKDIQTVFFDIKGHEAIIATGLFDLNGKAMGEQFPSNLRPKDDDKPSSAFEVNDRILLGLCRDHPFIQYLLETEDAHLAYYTLTFLAHELALCQKLLVPYTPFYHLVKEKLAADLRRAMMQQLLSTSPDEKDTHVTSL